MRILNRLNYIFKKIPLSTSSFSIKFLLLFSLFIEQSMASVPKPWQIGFQPSASPSMTGISDLYDILMIIIIGIGLFVTALILYVVYRFRASVNPEPSTVTHHTMLEIVWTLIPVLILIVIAVPSLKLLFFTDRIEKADLTVKAIGHQWYWSYEYPEQKIHFDSYLIEEKDLKPGQLRLLEVDNRVVVPVGKVVRLIVTSEDVLHSFAVPSFGIKKDAVPGRLNETWFKVEKEGVYYGQCSELCGEKHGFMPIAVQAVSQSQYDDWLKSKNADATEATEVKATNSTEAVQPVAAKVENKQEKSDGPGDNKDENAN